MAKKINLRMIIIVVVIAVGVLTLINNSPSKKCFLSSSDNNIYVPKPTYSCSLVDGEYGGIGNQVGGNLGCFCVDGSFDTSCIGLSCCGRPIQIGDTVCNKLN